MHETIKSGARRTRATLRLAASKFFEIDGTQRAAAFAYSAFFALFPLILLGVTAAAFFVDQDTAAQAVISRVEEFVPLTGEMQTYVFAAVTRVIKSRSQAGAVALLMLIWVAAQFFTTLIQATNRAWGTPGTDWWKLPAKGISLLFIISAAMLAGLGIPMLGKMAAGLLKTGFFLTLAYKVLLLFVPWLVVLFSLIFFYKLAPHRRTTYSEVWLSALCAALLLQAAQTLFMFYLKHFAAFNAVYGAFGGIMALLLWIYVSGVIFIFCACLSSAQAATRTKP